MGVPIVYVVISSICAGRSNGTSASGGNGLNRSESTLSSCYKFTPGQSEQLHSLIPRLTIVVALNLGNLTVGVNQFYTHLMTVQAGGTTM